MGETKIEWANYTFNAWIGCTKVSEGCRNCYAAAQNEFRKWNGGTWGPGAPRKRTSVANWRKPLQWNAEALKWPLVCPKCASRAGAKATTCTACGVERVANRPRVFCESLADVFDVEAPDELRLELFTLIRKCSALDWLLLTKRHENALRFLSQLAFGFCRAKGRAGFQAYLCPGYPAAPLPNVWVGVSVEDQKSADERIPVLLQVPAVIRFLSMGPLLGDVDLTHVNRRPTTYSAPDLAETSLDVLRGRGTYPSRVTGIPIDFEFRPIDWAIVEGESGPNARPMHPQWARSLRDQCVAAGVPFHFKQHGEWVDYESVGAHGWELVNIQGDVKYGRLLRAPHDLNGKQFETRYPWPNQETTPSYGSVGPCMVRVGKKAAGRLLDGVEWSQFPSVSSESITYCGVIVGRDAESGLIDCSERMPCPHHAEVTNG